MKVKANPKKKQKAKYGLNKYMENIKIIVYILFIALLIYFLYSIYYLVKNPTDIFRIENGTLYSEESTIGYVIRTEKVLQGENNKSEIALIKNEGEKVAINEPIFRYHSIKEKELNKEIESLNVQIDELLKNKTDIFSSDIEILEKEIQKKLEELYNENDIQKIKEYKKDINTAIIKKSKVAGDLSPSGSYINNLINKRASYENEINSSSVYITAPIAGTVSYRVDGLEDSLVTGDFSYLSKSLLEGFNIKTGQIVATSSNQGKIIDNFKCYLAVVTNSKQAKEAKVGNNIEIRLSSLDKIKTKIHYVAEESDGSRILVFELSKDVEKLISYRKISIDIIWWSYTGFKVPNSAITYDDDLAYITRSRAGYTDKILVKVLRQTENFSIVDNYDTNEMKEMGFTSKEIDARKSIKLHDEILKK